MYCNPLLRNIMFDISFIILETIVTAPWNNDLHCRLQQNLIDAHFGGEGWMKPADRHTDILLLLWDRFMNFAQTVHQLKNKTNILRHLKRSIVQKNICLHYFLKKYTFLIFHEIWFTFIEKWQWKYYLWCLWHDLKLISHLKFTIFRQQAQSNI